MLFGARGAAGMGPQDALLISSIRFASFYWATLEQKDIVLIGHQIERSQLHALSLVAHVIQHCAHDKLEDFGAFLRALARPKNLV